MLTRSRLRASLWTSSWPIPGSDPLTPIFPMENENREKEALEEYFRREVRPVFDKVAQEHSSTRVLGGSSPGEDIPHFHFQPHNFRRWLDFSRDSFDSSLLKTRASIGNAPLGCIISCRNVNSGHETWVDFDNFKFRIKKFQIEVLNIFDHKRTYRLPVSAAGVSELASIVDRMEQECVDAVRAFIDLAGGTSDFIVLKRKQEDKVMNESAISKIPPSQTFHNQLFKKVYEEPEVEFYDSVSTGNYISNRAIENISPLIADALDRHSQAIETVQPLRSLKLLVKKLDDVIRYKRLVLLLNDGERNAIEKWLMMRFGVSP